MAERAPGGAGRQGALALSTLAPVLAGVLLSAPQLVPTLVAWRQSGPGSPGAAGAEAPALAGLAGLVVRYASHAPAAVFALAAVPLLASLPSLRPAGAVVGLALLHFLVRGAPEGAGALPLAFDLAVALLGGLSLSAQWRDRRAPRGRRLRRLALLAALCAAAALSVATTDTGPLAPELAAPVGLLALALVLYFALAGSRDPVVARVFLLPLVVRHNLLLIPERPGINAEYIVPDGHYSMMGDNRDNSNDSRYWGVVPDKYLVGKAFMIWMNLSDWNVQWRRIGSFIN